MHITLSVPPANLSTVQSKVALSTDPCTSQGPINFASTLVLKTHGSTTCCSLSIREASPEMVEAVVFALRVLGFY